MFATMVAASALSAFSPATLSTPGARLAAATPVQTPSQPFAAPRAGQCTMRTNSVYGVDPYYNPRALHFPQTMSGNYLDGKTSAEMGRLPSDHALGGSGDGGYYPHLGKRKWDSRSATERWALNDDYSGYGRRGYDGGYTTNPGYGRPIGYNDYDCASIGFQPLRLALGPIAEGARVVSPLALAQTTAKTGPTSRGGPRERRAWRGTASSAPARTASASSRRTRSTIGAATGRTMASRSGTRAPPLSVRT